MDIFLDKSSYIWLHPGILERFWSEPLIANKSFFFARSWFSFSSIFNEKKWYFFVDDGGSFEIGSCEGIIDCIHELDDLEIRLEETSLFRYLTESSFHRRFIIFDMSLWEDILEIITSIFPCEHEDLYIRSFFPIHDTTSTLLIEFCCGHIRVVI